MASIDVLIERFYLYEKMYSQELREQTFVDWPFREECNCTPEKVKAMGFSPTQLLGCIRSIIALFSHVIY